MQIQQLRYFVAVAEVNHFTRAAELVGVTQPSLSKQVHALESDLGAPLFARERGNVRLTTAGEALLPLARRILADADTAHREVQQLVGLRRGRVRLGATPSLCTGVVADILRSYRDAHPGVELVVEENGSQDLVGHLARGELDLALLIGSEHGDDPSLHTEPVLRDDLVVVSSIAEPDRFGPEVAVADLRGMSLVMFRHGYDLRDTTMQLCRQHGFEPRLAVEGGEMDAVLSFVEAGLGVALVPSTVLRGRGRLRSTPLASPGAHRTVVLAQRREFTPSHAALALRQTVLDYVEDASARGNLPSGVVRL